MKVIFVCTGNTCRSPMAAAYLESKKLPDVEVSSRGILAAGEQVSSNAQLAMAEISIDISAHTAHQITVEDAVLADRIICLSPSHRDNLLAWGVDKNKLSVLENGISDPYGGGIEVYRRCRDEIFRAVDTLVSKGFFMGFKIVPLRPEQLSEVERLEKLCFTQSWSADAISEAAYYGTAFFAAESAGRLLGYIGIKAVADEGYITDVAVFPDHRRAGIATALLSQVCDYCREKKLAFVSLEVRNSNDAAISLYKKNGFKEEGRRRDFYQLPREDAIIMTRRFSYEDIID